MKLVGIAGGFMIAALAMPVAMAQQDARQEQGMEQFMQQDLRYRMQYQETGKKRVEKYRKNQLQYKNMHRNQLQEKQDGGFRMKGGQVQGR